MSQYLTISTSNLEGRNSLAPSADTNLDVKTKSPIQNHEGARIRAQNSLKSPAKLETEIENKAAAGKKRGRKPKPPLMEQVEQAYAHLHDLDWLQECGLASLPEMRQKEHPSQMMPKAQALRDLLITAARQVMVDMEKVPGKEGLSVFLKGHLAGKPVAAIAQELGVSREWCSRNYRREALRLAGMQFMQLISRDV